MQHVNFDLNARPNCVIRSVSERTSIGVSLKTTGYLVSSHADVISKDYLSPLFRVFLRLSITGLKMFRTQDRLSLLETILRIWTRC